MMPIEPSFRVYIDESGDDGFNFINPGTSRWFVLSAVVVRATNDHMIVSALDGLRALLSKPAHHPLHFAEMRRHDQRFLFANRVGQLHVRTVSIVVHKPSLPCLNFYALQKPSLYRYCTRLLMERISMLCRETREKGQGDGTATILFSKRTAMSYADLRDYIEKLLEMRKTDPGIKVCPTVIVPSKIQSVSHDKLAGLQAADCVASSIYQAVRVNKYGVADTSYLFQLKRNLHTHGRKCIGSGIKFYPDLDVIKTNAPEAVDLEGVLKM